MAEKKSAARANMVAGGVGGGFGVIAVVMIPKVSAITWSGEESALMMAACGAVFAWIVSYLPRPGNHKRTT